MVLSRVTSRDWVPAFVSDTSVLFPSPSCPLHQRQLPGRTETYIRVIGKWRYLYRAADCSRATIDFLRSGKQDTASAKRFLAKALGGHNHPAPRVIRDST